jgi:hypothetical protein
MALIKGLFAKEFPSSLRQPASIPGTDYQPGVAENFERRISAGTSNDPAGARCRRTHFFDLVVAIVQLA